jgi:hypothetical protein
MDKEVWSIIVATGLTVIGAGYGCYVGITSHYDDKAEKASEREEAKKQKEADSLQIESLKGQVIQLNDDVRKGNEEIRKGNEDVRKGNEANQKLSREIIDAQEELNKYGSGGDSYPQLAFQGVNDYGMDASVLNTGKYPLYDLKVTLYDVGAYEEARDKGTVAEERKNFSTFYNIGNVPANGIGQLKRFNWGNPALKMMRGLVIEKKLAATFFARNGFFRAQVVARYINGDWRIAGIVTDENGNVLTERAEEGFYKQGETPIKFEKGRLPFEIKNIIDDH